ncbi:TSC22 domain family protein 4 [Scophthalmus maximus]|uniref:TSC22 domain family protein 4-like n=1 Tax=Scophthalmus maximus TaxID=52904 RepID=A0A8D2ZPN8_SCOMX|nr:TSC22 domain family protein 4 [Scophthalmus maximus]XP_035463866.1 TSC22 domain family protein 4 [Scophthalmus maximus]XP_035463873.1 TSC22 domain family protein 4 [Scophthalmus maximus]XP_035463882.1 TSC22 domain family protein 4 [Scophthalmus maximus]XP_035463889.1 TSC22 domain family protein 4 [Scophthalmus maximus]
MSGGKKRSGFQITSVTSEFNKTSAGQSSPSVVLTILQSEAPSSFSQRGSSSQPTTPSLKRKYISHDALGQRMGSPSRFRLVRLAVGGASSGGRSEPYRRGRWMCTDFMERQEVEGFRRVMDSMRHAHSLESLETIGRDRGVIHTHHTAHLLDEPIRGRQGAGLKIRSGPPSPTHQEPINTWLQDHKQPMGTQGVDPSTSPLPPHPRNIPPPLRLDVGDAGRPCSPPAGSHHPSLTPTLTPAAFSLDQTIFNLQASDSPTNNSLVAIDNRIQQAMDLVKSHLMLAVREEVELLREQIRGLQEKNEQLERENLILRTLTHNRHTAH